MTLDAIPALKYEPQPIIHGLMTIVATAAFGSGLIAQRKENGNGGNE